MAPIRPIRNDADHAAALLEIERLWNAKEGTPEFDRLEVIGVLVDAYERQHHALEEGTAIGVIQHVAEQAGWTRKELTKHIFGTPARTSEVLNGKRALSKDMISRLGEHLRIPANMLLEAAPPPRPAQRKSASVVARTGRSRKRPEKAKPAVKARSKPKTRSRDSHAH
ncbi:MAG: hypothetical protein NVS3B10_06100 [Polyangiales bacterium]